MKELVEFLVGQLTEGESRVELVVGEDEDVINVYVNKSEIGKVIGKQGKIARAIRTIVRSASAKSGRRYSVEIIEMAE